LQRTAISIGDLVEPDSPSVRPVGKANHPPPTYGRIRRGVRGRGAGADVVGAGVPLVQATGNAMRRDDVASLTARGHTAVAPARGGKPGRRLHNLRRHSLGTPSLHRRFQVRRTRPGRHCQGGVRRRSAHRPGVGVQRDRQPLRRHGRHDVLLPRTLGHSQQPRRQRSDRQPGDEPELPFDVMEQHARGRAIDVMVGRQGRESRRTPS